MPIPRPMIATSGPEGSYASLFNPFSLFTSSVDRYPGFMDTLTGGNATAAWLLSKTAATALLASAITGGVVGVKRLLDVADAKDKNDPADNLDSQLSTTYRVPLSGYTKAELKEQKKLRRQEKKQEKAQASPAKSDGLTKTEGIVLHNDSLSLASVPLVAIPLAAMVLASAGTYKGANKGIDKLQDKYIEAGLKQKSNAARKLIKTRARVARGLADDEEVQEALDYATGMEALQKNANGDPGLARVGMTSLGLLLAGLGVASTIAGYTYFSSSDPDNIKYKAIKKGLTQYSVDRAINTPITISPTDDDQFFEEITTNKHKSSKKSKKEDSGKKELTARDLPEKQEAARPISVTF